jgi:HK97 family phage major capsid protein
MDYLTLRSSLLDKASAITAAADAEDRDLTAEELGQINAHLADAEAAAEKHAAVEAVKAQQAELNAAQPKVTGATRARVTECAPAIEKDPKRGFSCMGDFATAVVSAANPSVSGIDERLLIGSAPTGMNQTTGADGGFDVPPEFNTRIWDGLNEQPDNLLARTDQYTLENTESLTLNANAETSRVGGSRYGGIDHTWLAAEADQIPNSKPTVRQISLTPNELAVMVFATEKLLRNGTAMEQYLTRAAIDEIGFVVSDRIINGTGSGQPTGLVGHAGTVDVATTTLIADVIGYADIRNMWARCHARARRNAVWYVNQEMEPALMGLEDGNGNAIYLPSGNVAGSPFATLLGKPVIPIEYCQAAATSGDIILGDLNYYATALRSYGLQSASSIHLRFDFAEKAFRFIFEVDGRPWLTAPLTPANGTNTLSPFVTLADRV